jgi:2,3-dihydroxybiphenyl 1,2-dioxygenase
MGGTAIEALGYIGLNVSDLERWQHFASTILGLQASSRADGTIDLRMDNYASRIRLHEGSDDDLAYAGWEVRDAASLAAIATRLRDRGHMVEIGDEEICGERLVKGLIRFHDPEGNWHEAFFGPLQQTENPFVSPTGARFKTGRQGLGHIVLRCRNKPEMLAFFCDVLGFRISDHIMAELIPGRPMELTFLRCNGRHHSLALAPIRSPKRIVHLMFETLSIDDVGRALDRCIAENIHLYFTLGRHSNDEMLSFYPLSPSGFDIEFGWGGLEVDEDSWHVLTHRSISAWGHRFQLQPRPE